MEHPCARTITLDTPKTVRPCAHTNSTNGSKNGITLHAQILGLHAKNVPVHAHFPRSHGKSCVNVQEQYPGKCAKICVPVHRYFTWMHAYKASLCTPNYQGRTENSASICMHNFPEHMQNFAFLCTHNFQGCTENVASLCTHNFQGRPEKVASLCMHNFQGHTQNDDSLCTHNFQDAS
jgi:hypothetical protein